MCSQTSNSRCLIGLFKLYVLALPSDEKNWTDTYIFKNRNQGGLEPHEQVERAGRVLWILLKSWRAPKNPSIISVLLTI